MLQDYENGVIMDNTILIIDEKKSGFPVLTRVFQFLVIAIGSWSGISMLIDTIGIPYNTFQFNGVLLIITALLYAFCLHPSYGMVKLFFTILGYGLFFYSRLPGILNGFYIVENIVLRHISTYYGTELLQFVADYKAPEADTTLLLIMIMIPLIGILSLAVIRNMFISLCGVIMFLPVSICFALGRIPAEHYLIAYAACLLYLTRSGYSYYHSTNGQQKTLLHRISSQSAIWLSLLCLALFFLIKLFVSREDYDNLYQIKETKAEIQSAMYDFSIEEFSNKLSSIQLFTRKVTSTGLSGGELGNTGQVQYLNTKHLTITVPRQSIDEGIYLKGYVGTIYTGNRWEEHTEEIKEEYEKLLQRLPFEQFSPINQTSIFLDQLIVSEEEDEETVEDTTSGHDYRYERGTLKVEYEGANRKYLYAPYFTDYNAISNIIYEQDLYAAPARREGSYELPYYFNVSILNKSTAYESLLGKLIDYSEYERLYRDFVYRAYTTLPKDGLINIKRDFAPEQVKTETGSISEMIAYVKDYLHQHTSYSLTPGKLPEGEDFVEYFLYQNRVGYCAHYASAATLMLRALGIPARYIEGYAVGNEAINGSAGSQETSSYTNFGAESGRVTQCEVNVMDYNAHAWVEVYFDHCGWIPVEFTPGAAVDYSDSVVTDMEEFGMQIEDSDNDMSQEDSAVVPTTAIELPQPQPPINTQRNESSWNGTSRGPGRSGLMFLWIVLGTAILFLLLLLAVRRKRIRKDRYSKNSNRRAIFYFKEIETIIRIVGGLPGKDSLLEENEVYVTGHINYIAEESLKQLMEIARKARFGSGRILKEELEKVINYRETIYRRAVEELSLPKRIYLKLLLS